MKSQPSTPFHFWAQDLDNTLPDIVFDDRKELSSKKYEFERQRIVSLIKNVTKNAKVIEISKNVTVFIGEEEFVISIILPERDVLGRKAPILFHSTLANPDDQSFTKKAIDDLANFIHKINRTIPSDIETDINLALSMVKKKYYHRRPSSQLA